MSFFSEKREERGEKRAEKEKRPNFSDFREVSQPIEIVGSREAE